jgi:hypothetical protein
MLFRCLMPTQQNNIPLYGNCTRQHKNKKNGTPFRLFEFITQNGVPRHSLSNKYTTQCYSVVRLLYNGMLFRCLIMLCIKSRQRNNIPLYSPHVQRNAIPLCSTTRNGIAFRCTFN